MYCFKNDYSEGAHPFIINALFTRCNEVNAPYGTDVHSAAAADMIRELCKDEKAEVVFISGGTPTNVLAVNAFLRNSYEAVIAPVSGHINVHETGAIEYSGHKVISVPTGLCGKLYPRHVEDVINYHNGEHMLVPKMVYISQSSELGTIYSKAELTELSEYCHKNGLYLYMDGARLGSALMAEENDLTLADIASLVDAFYIGGTKNGLLFGEALVFTGKRLNAADHIRWLIKQHGFMLAKGYAAGIQFEEAFRDGLFFKMAKHENDCAKKIVEAIKECGFEFYAKHQTNQIFVILPNRLADELAEKFGCIIEAELTENRCAVRIVTSWATTDEAVDAICDWFYSQFYAGIIKDAIVKSGAKIEVKKAPKEEKKKRVYG